MIIGKVENFKHLRVINSENYMHREISERIISGNKFYHSINKQLKSKLLSKKPKTLLYISVLRLIITYAYETRSTTKGNNNRLAIFEKKSTGNIFGLVYIMKLRTFEGRKNDDVYKLYGKPNISSFQRIKKKK